MNITRIKHTALWEWASGLNGTTPDPMAPKGTLRYFHWVAVYIGRVTRRPTPPRLLTIRDPTLPRSAPTGPIRRAARRAIAAAPLFLYQRTAYPTLLGRTRTWPVDDSPPRVYDVYRTGPMNFYIWFCHTLPHGNMGVAEFDHSFRH